MHSCLTRITPTAVCPEIGRSVGKGQSCTVVRVVIVGDRQASALSEGTINGAGVGRVGDGPARRGAGHFGGGAGKRPLRAARLSRLLSLVGGLGVIRLSGLSLKVTTERANSGGP